MLASRRCSARPALLARARFKYSHLTDARKMLLRNTITAMTMGSGNRKSLSKSDINFVLDVETWNDPRQQHQTASTDRLSHRCTSRWPQAPESSGWN